MRLPRPHVPCSVKIKVALRQLEGFGLEIDIWVSRQLQETKERFLDRLLAYLSTYLQCPASDLRLDHDPALALRKFSWRTRKYTPDANDPDFLVYRTKEDHDRKTRLRGDGAQRSDISQIKKERRRLRKKKRKYRWPKGRKIQSRGFDKRRPKP